MNAPARRSPRLRTVAEVAEELKVSEKTVRRWEKSGDLHFHRLGRQLRVSEHDLALFLNRCRR
jgi:excisionase family DNA binding protein